MALLAEYGLIGLFVAAFLAATLLPLSSEVVLTATLIAGLPATSVVLVATLGNLLGAMLNYFLGYRYGEPLAKRLLRLSEADIQRARVRFDRYGKLALCFAWVPLIGDPITAIAGVLKIPFGWFLVLVGTAKFLRYVVLSYLILAF